MKFLTHDGLLYFWGKVKTYIDNGLSSKASKSEIPTSLPANGGSAANISNSYLTLVPYDGNQINFGGTSLDTSINFGYASRDNRPIPTDYYFGAGNAYVRGIPVAPPNTNYTYNICRNTVLTTYDYGANTSVDIANGSIIAVYE